MTATANLGLPFIEASQAQKHVTHNEALRILDAAIQIAVADRDRTAPPPSPAEGARHIVAAGASGAWSGQADAVATWQDGAWAFLAPKQGWCVWSVADDGLLVFDGAQWRDLQMSLANAPSLGVNTTAAAPNLLSVKSDAALFAAIDPAAGGSGDVRLQLSKDSAANTASVVFSNAYSGRAEFGLVGSDAFRLKISADGASFVDALLIDPVSGNATLPRGIALTGVVAPPPLGSDQDDYDAPGLAAAAVLQLWSDAARQLSGLAGGVEGRVVTVINVGSQPITLLDEAAASAAANRFALGGPLIVAGKQAAILRYDGTAARWRPIAGGNSGGVIHSGPQSLTAAQQDQALANLGGGDLSLLRGHISGAVVSNDATSPDTVIAVSAGAAVSADATTLMKIAAVTKNANAVWTAGTGNGAADGAAGYTALAASTWYYVFLIKRPDTGAVDVLTSKSPTSPTLPAGFSKARLIGAFRTNGASQIMAFHAFDDGDTVMWDAVPAIDYTTASLGTSSITITLVNVPAIEVQVIANVSAFNSANTSSVYLRHPSAADMTPTANSASPLGTIVSPNGLFVGLTTFVRADASRQIKARAVAVGTILNIAVLGWRWNRRGL
ncbi:hypothetical protein RPB_3457 [Rhodopseudomonas palustris HaA2]|uniref:DUF2793 domain-containing protein n=1 Tax=Rhodopseudomonas palustris (strain HaA2) TaxID=316058 RepID=Q2IUF7_RHOP2|nr:DUF2793 domain-containing protein [Rhodopseudomonas palustris]ABD08153.1 hypothetical protein RPB_3457 [Rhodopseudomonas palustris HaA2]